eukprot:1923111-Prymnesium_polylepis.1
MLLHVGHQQDDGLVAHNGADHLFDAVDLLEVDGHREDEDDLRMVEILHGGVCCAQAAAGR